MTKRLNPKDIPEDMELELVGEYYQLVPKVPERPEDGYSVHGDGLVYIPCPLELSEYYSFFNLFCRKNFTERHRDRTRIQNAIATAVEMVEPDFVPKRGVARIYFSRVDEGWTSYGTFMEENRACVSNDENAGRVLELLEKWEV